MSDSASFPLSGDNQDGDILPDLMAAASFGATEASPELPQDDRETIQEIGQETPGSLAEAVAEAARALGGELAAELTVEQQQTEGRPERRRRRRAMISAQVRVRTVDVTGDGPDEISMTVNVSRIGFLFLTTNPSYHRGMDVLLTFPFSSAPNAIQAEQSGRVARVSDLGDGQRAVAIAIGIAISDTKWGR
jgi:hypothetical protein